jgi:hypothetical protein
MLFALGLQVRRITGECVSWAMETLALNIMERKIFKEMKQTKTLFLMGMLVASLLVFSSMATAIEIGDKAPDFTLPSTTGETISLSRFRGRKYVLLEFYVNDFGAT